MCWYLRIQNNFMDTSAVTGLTIDLDMKHIAVAPVTLDR
jgi:hypothetical protein